MGPYQLAKDDSGKFVLEDRPVTWNSEYDMLFIDNPVGAGFSYTTKDEGYCKDTHECVARNLYSCIVQVPLSHTYTHTHIYICNCGFSGACGLHHRTSVLILTRNACSQQWCIRSVLRCRIELGHLYPCYIYAIFRGRHRN